MEEKSGVGEERRMHKNKIKARSKRNMRAKENQQEGLKNRKRMS